MTVTLLPNFCVEQTHECEQSILEMACFHELELISQLYENHFLIGSTIIFGEFDFSNDFLKIM